MRVVELAFGRRRQRFEAGVQGEHRATEIAIDVRPVLNTSPDAWFRILLMRPDDVLYVAVTHLRAGEDGFARYLLTNADTAVDGVIRLEIQAHEDDKLIKSVAADLVIVKSLGNTGADPPDPTEPPGYGDIGDLIQEAKESAQEARRMVDMIKTMRFVLDNTGNVKLVMNDGTEADLGQLNANVVSVEAFEELPSVGTQTDIYVIKSEGTLYLWNPSRVRYELAFAQPRIDIIDGGGPNG